MLTCRSGLWRKKEGGDSVERAERLAPGRVEEGRKLRQGKARDGRRGIVRKEWKKKIQATNYKLHVNLALLA